MLSSLQQPCEDPLRHFIWKDIVIQLSNSQLNHDRLITVEIGCKRVEVFYRSAPCLGVKYCPQEGCSYVVPICIREKRLESAQTITLSYIRHTIVQLSLSTFIHSLEELSDLKMLQQKNFSQLQDSRFNTLKNCSVCKVEDKRCYTSANPSEIACGKGIGFIPSAVDQASSHTGKVSQEIKSRTKQLKGMNDTKGLVTMGLNA